MKGKGPSLPPRQVPFQESLAKRLLTTEGTKRLRHFKCHEHATSPPHWAKAKTLICQTGYIVLTLATAIMAAQ